MCQTAFRDTFCLITICGFFSFIFRFEYILVRFGFYVLVRRACAVRFTEKLQMLRIYQYTSAYENIVIQQYLLRASCFYQKGSTQRIFNYHEDNRRQFIGHCVVPLRHPYSIDVKEAIVLFKQRGGDFGRYLHNCLRKIKFLNIIYVSSAGSINLETMSNNGRNRRRSSTELFWLISITEKIPRRTEQKVRLGTNK